MSTTGPFGKTPPKVQKGSGAEGPPRSTDEIRSVYLDFFRSKSHAVIPGASLIPENDPTVLFTTAGMHPLVPYILGEPHPAGKRLADCQMCIRTQDIDEVGDSSHLTFFEMLGRWSLGDYFKEGAIQMSFEFLTEVLQLPLEKLAVSCFGGDDRFPDMPSDDESAAIWCSVGIPQERIGFIRGGMLESKFNWWGPAGRQGPCGPDTEMFYWIADGEPTGNPATHPDLWLEIGNDVLIQYNKGPDGSFTSLSQKTVDEGVGLDRLAVVLQGVNSVYETDRMKPIFECVCACSPKIKGPPGTVTRRTLRIVVDHLKAATFIIADGVKPSNVDQGYVLRKLIRRAVRAAHTFGVPNDSVFTPTVAEEIIRQYGHVYSQLRNGQGNILEALKQEEQNFRRTLLEGIKHYHRLVEKLGHNPLDGVNGFHLYDTYGFPPELTKEMAKELGVILAADFDLAFKKAFEDHQKLSRAGAEKRFAGGLADHSSETTKLHTATHLLNAALRKVLGDHVWQKGSNVTAERLRFDFSHSHKMTPEEIRQVEEIVNQAIKDNLPVSYSLMTVDEAKRQGAIGVFGERYGDSVKVYRMGELSLEICGGPHVAHTGLLGQFKIVKEEAVSAGVRRIKATVSGGPVEIEVAGEAT